MNIKQFKYSSDNLGYLLYGEKEAVAIDGGAVEPILAFLERNGLRLKAIANTHSHPDHTVGNRDLAGATGAPVISFDELIGAGSLDIEGHSVRIRHTPGHSVDSVVFHDDRLLVSGDTLLIGKVGRCFTGDLDGFLESVKFFLTLAPHTLVYPGHDYVLEYMNAIKEIEPDNKHVDRFLATYDPGLVVSTIDNELAINPTLRFNDEKMIKILKKRGLAHATETERWRSIISLVHG